MQCIAISMRFLTNGTTESQSDCEDYHQFQNWCNNSLKHTSASINLGLSENVSLAGHFLSNTRRGSSENCLPPSSNLAIKISTFTSSDASLQDISSVEQYFSRTCIKWKTCHRAENNSLKVTNFLGITLNTISTVRKRKLEFWRCLSGCVLFHVILYYKNLNMPCWRQFCKQ